MEAKDQEINRLQEQLKRVTADTENYRKRMDANFERRVDSAKEDIEYIRYVDDMTFFSDSMETIYEKLPLIQRVFAIHTL